MRGKNIRIIWADDDVEFLNKAELLFNNYGFEIIKCSSIAQALRHVLLGESDNLLLDIKFPNSPKEGMIFLEQIKKINPELRVVLFTAYPETDDAVIAVKDLMASDYISKPIPIDDKKRRFFFQRMKDSFLEKNERLADKSKKMQLTKIEGLKASLEENNLDQFIKIMQSIFAGLTYNMKTQESYYHGYIQVILDLIGMDINSEMETNIGRIDAVIETDHYIYLMEFKLTDAESALEQIHERKYFQKYFGSQKEILLVGVKFDRNEKNISEYITQKMSH
ncbi:PD-(D/E)XK nuclease domain-containing protein [Winogradskyella sp.]|uniref:PD-(D/E)XK nuclease domain-containing protein n=1 Tax=Winogradskyella sp. TaxID=1883156 RepID=UPI003BAD06BD